MAIPHAHPGEVIDVRPLGQALPQMQTRTLIKTATLEVVRLVMAAGKQIADHRAPGEMMVQCLEGRIAFRALGRTQELTQGQLLYLAAGEPHSVQCLEHSSLLLTIVLSPRQQDG